jgi:hypothetical protein
MTNDRPRRATVVAASLVAAVLVSGTPPTDARIDTLRENASHAASMLVDSPLGATWAGRLDALQDADLDAAEVDRQLDDIQRQVTGVLDSVVAPEPFTFTMQGTSNTLRLPIRNTGTEDLRVDLRVRSPKLRIDEPLQHVSLPALSSVEVEVPVEARSQGTFTIEVDVLAPDGLLVEPPVVLKGRVQDIGGLSRVVTAGAVLVLASWWFTHLRRRRRARLATTGPLLDAAPATPPDSRSLVTDRPGDHH